MANSDISGQITDGSGNPIANAEVYLWREDLAGSGGVVATTTADSTGAYSFIGHPDGTGSSESWHIAAKDPNGGVQLLSAYGVTASLSPTVIGWATAADWDSATSEADVFHPSGTVKLGLEADGFESYTEGSAPPSPWDIKTGISGFDQHEVDDTEANSGSQSLHLDSTNQNMTNPAGGVQVIADSEGWPAEQYATLTFAYYETGLNNNTAYRILGSGGGELCRVGTDNPGAYIYTGAGKTILQGSPSPSYDVWRKYAVGVDWSNNTLDITWDDIGGSSNTQSVSNQSFVDSPTDIGKTEIVRDDSQGKIANGQEAWFDDVHGTLDAGSLTTATKSFSSTQNPNLQNLQYSLNGQSITADIIGSPGTPSEETVTQTLGGATSYPLTWSNAHTDFRVRPTLSTSDPTVTPTISRIELAV